LLPDDRSLVQVKYGIHVARLEWFYGQLQYFVVQLLDWLVMFLKFPHKYSDVFVPLDMVIPLPQFGSDGNTAEDGEGGVRV
jgi:hypothetical protein